MTIGADEARSIAASVAAVLRRQRELGVDGIPPETARRLLGAIGALVDPPRRRPKDLDAPTPASRAAAAAPTPTSVHRPWIPQRRGPESGVGSPALAAIRANLGDCRRCGLCTTRTQLVFGTGNPAARLMFIGEAPGEDEDRQGEPFVGRAGELLTSMIAAMGLERAQVYIANVVKCRPPKNRDPAPDEVTQCVPYLNRQIEAVAPEVIVTLGRVAPSALLGRDVRISRERGAWIDLGGVPAIMTYHPSYLLRLKAQDPKACADRKRETWDDLQAVMARLGLARAQP